MVHHIIIQCLLKLHGYPSLLAEYIPPDSHDTLNHIQIPLNIYGYEWTVVTLHGSGRDEAASSPIHEYPTTCHLDPEILVDV